MDLNRKEQYTLTLPGGETRRVEGPAGASQDILDALAMRIYAQERREYERDRVGFWGAAKQAFVESTLETPEAIGLTLDPTEENERAMLRDALAQRGIGWEDVKETFGERGVGRGVGDLWELAKQTAGSSLGAMAPGLVAGKIGGTLGALGGPKVAAAGAVGGFTAGMLPGEYRRMLSRQIVERELQRQAGETPRELEFGQAAAGAAAGTALNYLALVPAGITRLLRPAEEATGAAARRAAQQLADEGLATRFAKGTGLAAAGEVPTEMGQALIERAQAGLPIGLSDPDVREELEAAGVGALLISPLFGGGGRQLSAMRARAQLRELQQAEQREAAEQARAQQEAERQRLEQVVDAGRLRERARAEDAERRNQPPLQQLLALDADASALRTAEKDAAESGNRLLARTHQAGQLEAADLFNDQLPSAIEALLDPARPAETRLEELGQLAKAPLLRANPEQYNRVQSAVRQLRAQQKSEEIAERITALQNEVNTSQLLKSNRFESFNRRIDTLLKNSDLSTEQAASVGALRNTLTTNQVAALQNAFADLQNQPDNARLFDAVRNGVNNLKAVEGLSESKKTAVDDIEAALDERADLFTDVEGAPEAITPLPPAAAPSAPADLFTDVGDAPEAITPPPAAGAQQGARRTDVPTQEVNIADLKLSTDVPQFKSGADQQGIVKENKLQGRFDPALAAPVQVWRRLDGRLEVISGRHRLDLAKRSGRATIPAQIHNESEGFTAADAATLDIVLNVKDGRGKITDYLNYFETLGISEQQAESEGLLQTAVGRQAFTIATAGSPETIAAFRNDQINAAQAVAIANAAPKNSRLQAVGVNAAVKGANADAAAFQIKAVQAMAGPDEASLDLFGFDDSALREAEALARAAQAEQNRIRQDINAARGAAKNPEAARRMGVDVNNPAAVNQKIAELNAELEALRNFHTNPDLVRRLREQAGMDPKARAAFAAPPETEPDEDSPLYSGVGLFDNQPLFSRGSRQATPTPVTTLTAAFKQAFPRQAGALDSMIKRGEEGQRGGVVFAEDEAALAQAFADKTGRTLEEAQAVLQMSKTAKDGRIRRTVQELVEAGRDAGRDQGGDIEVLLSQSSTINGFYDPQSGLTFLNQSAVTADTIGGVLLHEAMHGGQNRDIDAKAMEMVADRDKASTPASLRPFLNAVAARMEAAGVANDAREASAYIVEEAAAYGRQNGFSVLDGKFLTWLDGKMPRLAKFLRDWIAGIRAWGLNHGINLNPTVDDLVALAQQNMAAMARGQAVESADSGIQYSESPNATQTVVDGTPEPAKGIVQKAVNYVTSRDLWNRVSDHFMISNYIVDNLKRSAPEVGDAADRMLRRAQQRNAIHQEWGNRVDDAVSLAQDLSPTDFDKAMRLVHRAVVDDKKWPFAPKHNPALFDPTAPIAKEFSALSPKQQETVRAMLQHNADVALEMSRLLLETVPNVEGFDQKAAEPYLRQIVDQLEEFAQNPYTSTRAVGDFIVVAKSDKFLQYESILRDEQLSAAARRAAQTELDKMRTQPNNFRVFSADSQAEAEQILKQQRANYGTGQAGVQMHVLSGSKGLPDAALPFESVRKLRASILNESKKNPKAQASLPLLRMLDRLYIESLSDSAARKKELRRFGSTELSPTQLMRSFVRQGMADAHYIASMATHSDIAEATNTMTTLGRRVGDIKVERSIDELANRFERSHEINMSPLLGNLMNVSAFWMLLTKPAYFLYNATQPMMMGMPWLARDFSPTAAYGAMLDAYKVVGKSKNMAPSKRFSLENIPANERYVVERLIRDGLFENTMMNDTQNLSAMSESRVTRSAGRVMNYLRNAAVRVEQINRSAMGIAAYNLELKKNGGDKAKAYEYARNAVLKTQGDYSLLDRPSVIAQSQLRRFVFQFRAFQFIQAGLLIRMMRDAGLSTEEKRAATRGLMFMIGHHAAVGGAVGLPAFATLAAALQMFGEITKADEPYDLEEMLNRMFGKSAFSDALIYGVPAGLFNVNIAQNLGLGQTFSAVPFSNVTFDRAGYEQAIFGMLGPTVGLGAQWVTAVSRLHGSEQAPSDYYGFIASLMPGAIKSSMQALNEQARGVTNTRGDTLVDPEEVVLWDSIAKAMGFTTHTTYVRRMALENRVQFEQFFSNKTRSLRNRYASAFKRRDLEAMRELRAAWFELQRTKRDFGFTAQPIADLLRAPEERAKRERETVGGVQITRPGQRELVERLTGE